MVWGTLEEEGRQLGQGKRVRTPRLEREQCYSPFLRQPLSRVAAFLRLRLIPGGLCLEIVACWLFSKVKTKALTRTRLPRGCRDKHR